MAEPKIETYKGKEIASKIDPIIQYINTIYREPPFLYNGQDADYKTYLNEYANDPDAYLNVVMDNNTLVGLSLGMPLSRSRDLYKLPFKQVDGIYYAGEFGLNPSYQGKGLENELIKWLEKEAKSKGYDTMAFWELDSSPSKKSPLLPFAFWEKQGYKHHPELGFKISWTNIGEDKESEHTAVYWLKKL